MGNNINLGDVRSEAMDVIRMLKDKKIEVKEAREIKGLLDTIVDTAKTQVEFLKTIPEDMKREMKIDGVKAISKPLTDPDAELDLSLKEIEERRSQPYLPDSRERKIS